jgi:Tol biopolymer transport system component/DNA-binding winged helix-turn-helix (wHTH) protein
MNASSLPANGRPMFDDEALLRPNLRLRVGEHVVDVGALRVVTHPEHPRLTSKAAAVLIELVRHAGDTVTRDSLFDRVWADRVTTQDVLTQAIKELRRAFGDDGKPPRYIETIPKVGYRLLAPVSLLEAEPVPAGAAPRVPAGNDPELVAAAPGPARSEPSRRYWLWLLAAVAVAAVVLALALRERGEVLRSGGWIASDLRAVTSDPGSEQRPALSPDGTRVAYSHLDPTSGPAGGVDRIMLRALGQSQSMRLTARSESFEEAPAWSPDGSQIAFERLGMDSCTVYIVSSLGGAEREVGACRNYVTHYFDWTPDGRALITAESSGGDSGSMVLMNWDLATGRKQPLQYPRTADDQDLEAHYSPDGRYLAFRRGLAPYSDLCVMAATGGEVRQLTQLHSRIRGYTWTRDSSGLVFSSNHEGHFTLYTVDLDSGSVHALGVGPAEYPNAARGADVVSYEIPRTTNRLAWAPLGGDKAIPELLAKSTGSDGTPALSPDGNRIAFISDRSGTQQVWLYDFAESAATPLSDFRDALLMNPAWSADGKRVLITVRSADKPGLVEIDLASHRQRTVSRPGMDVLWGAYGADADSFVLVVGSSSRQNQLVLMERAGADGERQMLLATGTEHVEFDASQRRVYYTRNAVHGLYSRSIDGGDEQLVTELVDANLIDGWRIVDGRVWFVGKIYWKPSEILEFDPATGNRRQVAHLDTELRDVAFSVTPKRDRIVLAPLGIEDTDIGAFKLTAAH